MNSRSDNVDNVRAEHEAVIESPVLEFPEHDPVDAPGTHPFDAAERVLSAPS